MICRVCKEVVDEPDAQFCPFCGTQIRASQASDPDRRAHATTDAPGSSRRSQLHRLLKLLMTDRHYRFWFGTEQPISRSANLSLIFAYLGIIQCVPLLFSILAIVVGYHALDDLMRSPPRMDGSAGVDVQSPALLWGAFNWRCSSASLFWLRFPPGFRNNQQTFLPHRQFF
jgi:hypothetical protein